jgi:protein-tyrosine phosphatase
MVCGHDIRGNTMKRLAVLLAVTMTAASLVGLAPAGAKTATTIEGAVADCSAGTSCTITWTGPSGTVTVYDGTDVDAIDTKVTSTDEKSVTVDGLDPNQRYYFELRLGNAKDGAVVADRSLHLATAPNARDIGGYATTDGHHVKWGQVFRSDAISKADAADLAKLDALGIKLICDFRGASEVEADGADQPVAGAEELSLPILDESDDTNTKIRDAITSGDTATQEALLGNGKAAQILTDAGKTLANSPAADKAYTALLERLEDPADLPTLTHCTAGKDRTGWSTAIILSALGVPKQTVIDDYLLTNQYTKDKNAATLQSTANLIDPALLSPLLEVAPEYIKGSFAEVKKKYGTFDKYLTKGLGVSKAELAALKKNLLTD